VLSLESRDGNFRRAAAGSHTQSTRRYVGRLVRFRRLPRALQGSTQCGRQRPRFLRLQGWNCFLHSRALGVLRWDVSKRRPEQHPIHLLAKLLQLLITILVLSFGKSLCVSCLSWQISRLCIDETMAPLPKFFEETKFWALDDELSWKSLSLIGFCVQEIPVEMFSPCPGLNPYNRSFWVSVINILESRSSSQVLCFLIGIISEQYLFFFLAQLILCKCLFLHGLKLNMNCRFQAPYEWSAHHLPHCILSYQRKLDNYHCSWLSGFWFLITSENCHTLVLCYC